MNLFLVALAQAVSAVPPEKIDLAIKEPCEARAIASNEVLVCGPRGDGSGRYRLKPLLPVAGDLPRAEAQVARGMTASAETEYVEIGGTASNRLMIRLKFKF